MRWIGLEANGTAGSIIRDTYLWKQSRGDHKLFAQDDECSRIPTR